MALAAGATNGPIDMSVTVNFLVTEAGILALMLGSGSVAAPLQARFVAAEATCETQGTPNFQLLLTPLEQGLIMGALAPATCQFSSGLRWRMTTAMTAKLAQLGAQGT